MPDPKGAAAEPQPKPQTPPNEDPPQDPPPAKTYSQDEVDRIAAKVRRNAARDAELRLRRQAPAAAAPQPKEDPAPAKDEEPKRDDFDTFEDHQRALAAFEGRKAAREEREKEKEEEQKRTTREAQEKAEQTWKGKIEKAMSKHADFEDVLEDAPEQLLNDIYNSPMRQAIVESEVGPEIVLHLVKNAAEVARIKALPGYKQAAEIVKIEDSLAPAAPPKPKDPPEDDDEETPEAKEAREARERDSSGRFKKDPPPPIEPGAGRSATNSSMPSDKDDAETWRRKELARMRKQQGK